METTKITRDPADEIAQRFVALGRGDISFRRISDFDPDTAWEIAVRLVVPGDRQATEFREQGRTREAAAEALFRTIDTGLRDTLEQLRLHVATAEGYIDILAGNHPNQVRFRRLEADRSQREEEFDALVREEQLDRAAKRAARRPKKPGKKKAR